MKNFPAVDKQRGPGRVPSEGRKEGDGTWQRPRVCLEGRNPTDGRTITRSETHGPERGGLEVVGGVGVQSPSPVSGLADVLLPVVPVLSLTINPADSKRRGIRRAASDGRRKSSAALICESRRSAPRALFLTDKLVNVEPIQWPRPFMSPNVAGAQS